MYIKSEGPLKGHHAQIYKLGTLLFISSKEKIKNKRVTTILNEDLVLY